MSVVCPECENPITVDADVIEEGDTLQCDECGIDLEVVSLDPLELAPMDDSGYVEEDEVRHDHDDDE